MPQHRFNHSIEPNFATLPALIYQPFRADGRRFPSSQQMFASASQLVWLLQPSGIEAIEITQRGHSKFTGQCARAFSHIRVTQQVKIDRDLDPPRVDKTVLSQPIRSGYLTSSAVNL